MMTNGSRGNHRRDSSSDLERPRDRLALANDPKYVNYRAQVLTFLYEKQRKGRAYRRG